MLSSESVQSQVIVTLNGIPTFDTSTLTVTEAGLDFPSNISEIQANTTISIRNNGANNPNNYNYRLSVSLLEMIGDIGLTIERTGTGTNSSGGAAGGRISGGSPAVLLSTLPMDFIQGTGDRFNVPVRFGIRNLSVTQPAGNLSFRLVFTATAF